MIMDDIVQECNVRENTRTHTDIRSRFSNDTKRSVLRFEIPVVLTA